MDRVSNLPVGKAAESASSSSGTRAGIVLTASAIALLFVAWLGQPRNFANDHWYALLTVEGTTTYTDYPSEKACQAAEGGEHAACFSGTELKP